MNALDFPPKKERKKRPYLEVPCYKVDFVNYGSTGRCPLSTGVPIAHYPEA